NAISIRLTMLFFATNYSPWRRLMKSCPTCNRTFEDTMSFCLADGSILSAPFDPNTGRQHTGAASKPPPTMIYRNGEEVEAAPEATQDSPTAFLHHAAADEARPATAYPEPVAPPTIRSTQSILPTSASQSDQPPMKTIAAP